MAYQNINQYNFRRWGIKPVNEITDICLASDERDYDQEVIFSPLLIGELDGNRMPFRFDFNSSGTTLSPFTSTTFDNDTIVSENYWNPIDIDPNYCAKITELCDVGLTGIDNGLVKQMSGETIEINTGLYENQTDKFSRYKYDRRMKLHPITGFTTTQNRLWDDNSYNYDLYYDTYNDSVGYFARLKGGFFQGFYKIAGYDYQVFPERNSLGWTTEVMLRYRWTGDTSGGLNNRYPDNKGTFFYMGARAENKFYHYADGEPFNSSDVNGTWKLYIQDFAGEDVGSLSSATISFCISNQCIDHYSNEKNIIINDDTTASVYPITFDVSNYNGEIDIIQLKLSGYTHEYPGDLGMLLVAPNGSYTIISGREDQGTPAVSENVVITNDSSTLWDGYSSGTFINNGYAFDDMPFSSPCPYQFFSGDTTENINQFTSSANIRVTHGLKCMKTCGCAFSANTASTCLEVYQISGGTIINCNCNCSCSCSGGPEYPEKDPLYDGVSNAMSLRLSGDTGSPRLCVKVYTITGGCVTEGVCVTGLTYQTGYTVTEWCSSRGIFDDCSGTTYSELEHWAQIDAVFERNTWLDSCDLWSKGGVGLITSKEYFASLQNDSISLVTPPTTHQEVYDPPTTEVVNFKDVWMEEKNYRMGKLKLYVNGKLFMVVENFEEIIPRLLNVEKEKQIGVGYNISIGGGTQGLHDNLTFSGGCPLELSALTYQQDPECLTSYDLSNTIYDGLNTNIKLEEFFGGSLVGDISAFRMYTEPLNAAQIKHNFRILKDKYNLLNPDCLDCTVIIPPTPENFLLQEDLNYLLQEDGNKIIIT